MRSDEARPLARVATSILLGSGLLLGPACANFQATEGFGLSISFKPADGGPGNIHEGSIPGALVRHDVDDGTVRGRQVLVAEPEAVFACISPFGDRIAYTRANHELVTIAATGGERRVIGNLSSIGPAVAGKLESPGIQWPLSEGGRWIYYTDNRDNSLRRIPAAGGGAEVVTHFNRGVGGAFALSMDATPARGAFIKRTDNYAIAIYDLSAGDGDLHACTQSFGCGNSLSPDGTLCNANSGDHISMAISRLDNQLVKRIRVNQWDGDPTAGISQREKLEWAWQSFRWSVNAMNWIAVTQGRLKLPSNTYSTLFQDAVLYDWVNERQINLTRNPEGRFDRAAGFFERTSGAGQSLGFFAGEAPLTVTFQDPRIPASAQWAFGDGEHGQGAAITHRYVRAGSYEAIAADGTKRWHARVTVAPRAAPSVTCTPAGNRALLFIFSEPVTTAGVLRVVEKHAGQARPTLSTSGRRLTAVFDRPLPRKGRVTLAGIVDRSQEPNSLASDVLPFERSPWPTNPEGVVYQWDSGKARNAVFREWAGDIRELHVSRASGIDRHGRLNTAHGSFGTGFFSQSGARMDFRDLVTAEAMTLELTLQSHGLDQHRRDFPGRIVNCSAWHDGDWEFMLGQQRDALLFSVRTSENLLDMGGKPVREGLHGRAPVYVLTRLPDTQPHHLVISYTSGVLRAYLDGRTVFQTNAVTGSLRNWGYGELVFGGNHNSNRYRWSGRLDGIAFYRRVLSEREVRANFDEVRRRLAARRDPPGVRLTARLLERSAVPEPAAILPYEESLSINAYEVLQVLDRERGWRLDLRPGQAIHVAQWGVKARRRTGLERLAGDEPRTLRLERYDRHPEKLERVVTINDLSLDSPLTPLLYEPEPPAGQP